MKPLLFTLLFATLCTGYGQTLKSVMYNTTNNMVVGLSNAQRLNFEHIGLTAGTATAPSLTYASGTNSFGTFASTAIGIGPFLGFSVDGTRRFFISTNAIRAELPLSFNNATNEAVTRTNLGLGATWLTNDNVTNFRTAIGLGLPALTNTNVGNFIGALGLSGTNATPVEYASALFDVANSQDALRIEDDEWIVSASSVGTNAPTDATNAVRWIIVNTGTNAYYLPLFQ